MCQFFEKSFVETLRIEGSEIHNLIYHNERMNRTRRELFGSSDLLDLSDYICPESYTERTKCRVVYAKEIIKVEYAAYHMRSVRTLTLLERDTADYRYKSTDRTLLNDLFACKGDADDVLLIRHGLLTDTTICNIALWNGEEWLTPAAPLLQGTMRASLLDRGTIREHTLCANDLKNYTRIRLFNALIDFGEVEIALPKGILNI